MSHIFRGLDSLLSVTAAAPISECPVGSDDQFGPQIAAGCRVFDFTLLFEDSFFVLLPAAVFLLLLPSRWRQLQHQAVKVVSDKLAVQKLVLLATLLILHVVYTAFQAKSPALRTGASIPAAVINIAATLAATWTSFLEDQRSIAPSYILVIYFSAASLLSLPRLRSLWLITSEDAVTVCRGLWTTIFVFTVLVLFAESASRFKSLQPLYQLRNREERSGFWGRSFYVYLLPLLKAGNSKVLDVNDLPEVDAELQGEDSGDKLRREFEKRHTSSKYILIRAAFAAYRSIFLWAIPSRLALTAFNFSQPFLITTTINFMVAATTPENRNYGPSLVGAYILVYSGITISTAVYWRQSNRVISALRAGLVSMIYDKTLGLQPEDLGNSAAVTLMGTDIERIAYNLRTVHELWASIIEISIALWLLGRQVGVACVIPLVIALFCIGVMVPISSRSGVSQKQWIERVQKRVAITSTMVGDIKAMQMLGLSKALSKIVTKLRQIEVETSLRFRKLLIWQVVISNIPLDFTPFATLVIYAGISVAKKDASLLSAQAFTSLALISLLTSPLLQFCQAIPSFSQAISCFDRIEEYCKKDSDYEPRKPTAHISGSSEIELHNTLTATRFGSSLISFQDATILRSLTSPPVLQTLNFDIRRGITAIIGPVASGKTTLLEAMLGRHVLQGSPTPIPLSRAAYAPQTPWIMNTTIRDNIIGTNEFEQKWYDFVVSACGLEDDLKNLSGGDQQLAGSRGASLSGGQKQRVALARAVYSKIDLLVFDSPFSGLDSKVLERITKRLFSEDGHFKQAGRSVIMVTNNYQILSHADNIIALDQGTIFAQGSYDDMVTHMSHIFSELQTNIPKQRTVPQPVPEQLAIESRPEELDANDGTSKTKSATVKNGSWSVYSYYIGASGWALFIMSQAAIMVECFCSSFASIWVQWWVDANAEKPNQRVGLYIGVYGVLTFSSMLGLAMCCRLYLINILSRTSLKLHADLLDAVLAAPFAFFQTIDTGSIINRFSQDLELMDMMFPVYYLNFVEALGSLMVKLIIICVVGKYLATCVPFVAVIVYFIQSFYLRTSRQIRILDIEVKAPLYTQFLETIDGVACIRAFGWGSGFRARSQQKLNESQKAFYMFWSIQQWLQLVVNLLVGAIAVVLVATVTSLKSQFNAASVGVALNLLLSFNENLTRAIKMWTMVEMSIGAVTRIQTFSKDTPREEEQATGLLDESARDWLQTGDVQFDNISAGYSTSSTTILKNFSLKISPGEKVAVCGGSGAGKTSFIMAILRMLDIRTGKISVSGTDITTVPRSLLRSTINVIPQEPLLLPGTFRFNLDPQGLASDDKIEYALRKVDMWELVLLKGGLDAELEVQHWSVGQKQLFELARAIVVRSPILILDEATSSMDWETESTMQSVIETEFADQTVIAVIHRFRYIDLFDRVVLLKHGCLAENGDPTSLLAAGSEFRKLYQAWKKE